eukprot:3888563-Pleurochrysis_carterae.AAC.3
MRACDCGRKCARKRTCSHSRAHLCVPAHAHARKPRVHAGRGAKPSSCSRAFLNALLCSGRGARMKSCFNGWSSLELHLRTNQRVLYLRDCKVVCVFSHLVSSYCSSVHACDPASVRASSRACEASATTLKLATEKRTYKRHSSSLLALHAQVRRKSAHRVCRNPCVGACEWSTVSSAQSGSGNMSGRVDDHCPHLMKAVPAFASASRTSLYHTRRRNGPMRYASGASRSDGAKMKVSTNARSHNSRAVEGRPCTSCASSCLPRDSRSGGGDPLRSQAKALDALGLRLVWIGLQLAHWGRDTLSCYGGRAMH